MYFFFIFIGQSFIPSGTVSVQPAQLEKVMLKAASKKNLKEMKTFVLRNVPTSNYQH